MGYFTGFVLYTMIWWLTLFAVLPLWTRPVVDPGLTPGGWTGHPEQPLLWRKLALTTAVATLLWCLSYGIIQSGWISFRSGWWALPND